MGTRRRTTSNPRESRCPRSGSTRTITVVWSKRNEGPQRTRRDAIRMARSVDGGRTFAPAAFAHDSALSGARGWESLTVGADGRVHAVWLDGRDAERKMAEAAHSGMAHKGQPPQDIYHGTIARRRPHRRERDRHRRVFLLQDRRRGRCARRRCMPRGATFFPAACVTSRLRNRRDGGRRFDPLVRVSEDKWELNGCPEDGPTLAVDQAGDDPHRLGHSRERRRAAEGAVLCDVARRQDVLSARAIARCRGGDAGPSAADAHARWRRGHCVGRGGRRGAACRVHEGVACRRLRAGADSERRRGGVESGHRPSEGNVLVAWTSRSSAAKSAAMPSAHQESRRISHRSTA